MKKLIFICLLGFLSTTIYAQAAETVYIRIQEPIRATSLDAKMVVIKPDNTSETVELSKLGKEKSVEENGIALKKEIEKWMAKGFKLITMNSSGGDSNNRIDVFMRKE